MCLLLSDSNVVRDLRTDVDIDREKSNGQSAADVRVGGTARPCRRPGLGKGSGLLVGPRDMLDRHPERPLAGRRVGQRQWMLVGVFSASWNLRASLEVRAMMDGPGQPTGADTASMSNGSAPAGIDQPTVMSRWKPMPVWTRRRIALDSVVAPPAQQRRQRKARRALSASSSALGRVYRANS